MGVINVWQKNTSEIEIRLWDFSVGLFSGDNNSVW